MRSFLSLIPLVLSVIIAASGCSRRVEGGYKTTAFVNTLLADSLPEMHRLAALSGKTDGSIVLIGEPAVCLRTGEMMMVCDEFDNIDARKSNDGLPDFAGETLVPILDFSDTSAAYDTSDKKSQERLRDRAVRNAVAALRIPHGCKIIVICSPALSEYGGGDVADLFERIGCNVPVIHSADTAYSLPGNCFIKMREKNLFTHNISYPRARLLMAVPDSSGDRAIVLPFIDSLVPASFPDTVGVLAPNTYYSHVVQNQH